MTPAPPYTQEQIALLRTPEEKLRAKAELSSYVERLRQTAGQGRRFHPYLRPATHNTGLGIAHKSSVTRGVSRSISTIQTSPLPTAFCPGFTATGTFDGTTAPSPSPPSTFASNTPVGYCTQPTCELLHDPAKQALCRRWLYSKTCTHGINCDLSHDSSPNNAPTCLHFMRGLCKNPVCRFAHVRIEPSALNCEQFGRLGYCERGEACPELHAHECAAFSNTGHCIFGVNCRHGHVYRAARMRQGSHTPTKTKSPLPGTPIVALPSQPGTPTMALSSQPGTPFEDSDTAEEKDSSLLSRNASSQAPRQFSQQDDFIPFED